VKTYAEMILISAAPWDPSAALLNSAINKKFLPPISNNVAGVLSATFLDKWGKNIPIQYKVAGLTIDDLNFAAKRGAMFLICGGLKRQKIAFAALKSQLVSVLFTDNFTADWLLKQQYASP
jgi:DNA-binding transcriptional regulator LsrR (DeoR family)